MSWFDVGLCSYGSGGQFVGLEDLRLKRAEIDNQIQGEEEEKVKIQNDLHILTERLARCVIVWLLSSVFAKLLLQVV